MTSRLRKMFQIYLEQKQTGIENVKYLVFLEIDSSQNGLFKRFYGSCDPFTDHSVS